MKRVFIFLMCVSFLFQVKAQQIENGGFGYFMTGPTFVFSSKIDQYLSRPDVLGPSYSYPTVAMQAGGEGFGMTNRVLIGGGGYGVSHFKQSGDSASVIQSGGGGYFKAGYVVWSKERSFMTANLGFGGFGYTYEIRNERSKNGVFFNQEFPVRTGEMRKYSYGGTTFDFMYGIETVVGGKQEGGPAGFMLGLNAGCLVNVATGDWSGDEDNIIGPPAPGVSSIPYIRITIGGGGFGLKSED